MRLRGTDSQTLVPLMGQLYEGATDPGRWPDILGAIGEWLGVPKTTLFTPFHGPEVGGFSFLHGLSPGDLEVYYREFPGEDLWARRAQERGSFFEGFVTTGLELASLEEFHASRAFRDYFAPRDIHKLLSCVVFDGQTPGLPTTICSSNRGRFAPDFEEADKARLRLLLPHLSRALGVMMTLRDAQYHVAASQAALNAMGTGVILWGPEGDVAFANRTAERILESQDGLGLRRDSGRRGWRLRAEDAAAQNALMQGLRGALAPRFSPIPNFSQALPVPRPSGKPPFSLRISHLAVDNPFSTGAQVTQAIAFLSDPTATVAVDEAALIRVFDLSPTEARVAAILAQGGTLEAAAAPLGVTVNTLKSHLQQIYLKTEVNDRARLARLILQHALPTP